MKNRVGKAMLGLVMVAGAMLSVGANAACVPVGGTIMTNLGILDPNTTLGTYTGDLAGAVSARLLSQSTRPDGKVAVVVQHYHVTDKGDTINFAPATMLAMKVSETRLAVVDYPARITGGTGKFLGATGNLNTIGEVDFQLGQASMRYRGTVCYK